MLSAQTVAFMFWQPLPPCISRTFSSSPADTAPTKRRFPACSP